MLFDVFGSGFAGFKFLAICHTSAAWYCVRSMLPSVMVLAINSLSVMKNQKMSLVRIAAVSLEYSHNGMYASTTLYHSSMLLLPCQKAVNKSNLAQTALDCGLQKSLNLDHMVCNVTSSVGRFHEIYISSPASPDHWNTFLHLALNDAVVNLRDKALLDIGTYTLHIAHNAFGAGISEYGKNTQELAMDLHAFFHASAARKEELQNMQALLNIDEYVFL